MNICLMDECMKEINVYMKQVLDILNSEDFQI